MSENQTRVSVQIYVVRNGEVISGKESPAILEQEGMSIGSIDEVCSNAFASALAATKEKLRNP